MSRGVRVVIGSALALLLVVGTGVLTRWDLGADAQRAELRLAWRVAVPRVEECRAPTAEEQAELPVHMRQAEICEGRSVSYRLEVRVDDERRHRSLVEAAGARADRPLQVFEALSLAPGARHLEIVFERTDGAETGQTAVPDRLVFDRELQVRDREVVLVTYDADARQLVRRQTGN